ncbi:MAG: 30S ribosomal protein S27e [Thaumarchaeota archaeon]|nr:30S ribosomal protein S27e [Nitrososphaerota archaeon]|tara:strand:- start:646 stop:843 length:198 start_codon:yes stop_codon:yes gene_type:complete
MKRHLLPIPNSRSSFLSVQCKKCGNERIIFSTSTLKIKCKNCDTLIAENTGGKAIIHGTVIKRVD